MVDVTQEPMFSDGEEDIDVREPELPKNMMKELLLVCSSLGANEGVGDREMFSKGEDCLEWIADLQRAIRREESSTRAVTKKLGSWKIFQKKLLPLVLNYRSDRELVFAVTKVMVMLTMPPNAETRNSERLHTYNLLYKQSFLEEELVAIFMSLLEEPLSHEGRDRTEKDNLQIELIVTLFRNLLAIKNPSEKRGTANDHMKNLHEELVLMLDKEYVLEVIFLLTQDIEAAENKDWNLLLLEIFDLLFQDQDLQALIDAHEWEEEEQRYASNDMENSMATTHGQSEVGGSARRRPQPKKQGLKAELSIEKSKRANLFAGAHSRSGWANISVKKRGYGSQTRRMILHTPFSSPGCETSTVPKVKRRFRKANKPLVDLQHDAEARAKVLSGSTLHRRVRCVLYKAMDTLLSCFVPFVRSIKAEFRRESSKLMTTDRELYSRVISACSKFHRLRQSHMKRQARGEWKGFLSGPIFESLDMWSFRTVLKACDSDRQNKQWDALPSQVNLLKEMFLTISEMRASADEANRKISSALLNKVFYERHVLDLLPGLLKEWKPGMRPDLHRQRDGIVAMDKEALLGLDSVRYVADLVELNHVVLKMLEMNAKGSMLVLSKSKRKNKKKKKKKKKSSGEEEEEEEELPSDNDNDEELDEARRAEKEFDFNNYFRGLCTNNVLKLYLRLLENYKQNSMKTNHYIYAFMHRLANFSASHDVESELNLRDRVTYEPMLYHVHVLAQFEKILLDPVTQKAAEWRPFLFFIQSVVRHFFRLAEKNHLLFVEALFWRGNPGKECEQISRCYDSYGASRVDSEDEMDEFIDNSKPADLKSAEGGASDSDGLDGEYEFDDSKVGKSRAQRRAEKKQKRREHREAKRAKAQGKQLQKRGKETFVAALDVARSLMQSDAETGGAAILWLAAKLSECYRFRSGGADPAAPTTDSPRAVPAAMAAWALVPVSADQFRHLESQLFEDLLLALQLKEPREGQWMWRVGVEHSLADLKTSVTLLNKVSKEEHRVPPPAVGSRVEVLLPEDNVWHSVEVKGYDQSTSQHRVSFDAGGRTESLSLADGAGAKWRQEGEPGEQGDRVSRKAPVADDSREEQEQAPSTEVDRDEALPSTIVAERDSASDEEEFQWGDQPETTGVSNDETQVESQMESQVESGSDTDSAKKSSKKKKKSKSKKRKRKKLREKRSKKKRKQRESVEDETDDRRRQKSARKLIASDSENDAELEKEVGEEAAETQAEDMQMETQTAEVELEKEVGEEAAETQAEDMQMETQTAEVELEKEVGEEAAETQAEDMQMETQTAEVELEKEVGEEAAETQAEDMQMETQTAEVELEKEVGEEAAETQAEDMQMETQTELI